MNARRFIHGTEAEARRLYHYGHEVTSRASKRHLTHAQAVGVTWCAIGLLVGVLVGGVL